MKYIRMVDVPKAMAELNKLNTIKVKREIAERGLILALLKHIDLLQKRMEAMQLDQTEVDVQALINRALKKTTEEDNTNGRKHPKG